MRDGFSRIDADLEALDGWIDCHKAERNRMSDCLDSLERIVESLVEAGIEKDHQIEELQVQVQGVRTGSPPNPNSGCPEIQPNTTNSGGPNNRYTKV